MSQSDAESDVPESAVSDDAEIVLVEIEDGVAMLFGKYSATDLGLETYDVPEKQTGSWSVDNAAIASGVANFVAQSAHEAMISRGLVAWRLNSFTVWWGNGAWRINQPRPCRFVMVTKRYLRRWCVQAPQPQGQRSGRGSCCWPPGESRMR